MTGPHFALLPLSLLLLCSAPMGVTPADPASDGEGSLNGYQVVRVKEEGSSSNNNNNNNSSSGGNSVIDSLDRIFSAVLDSADVLM